VGDFQPVDMTFAEDGSLYATDGHFSDWLDPSGYLDWDYINSVDKPSSEKAIHYVESESGNLYEFNDEGCHAVVTGIKRPFSVFMYEGEPCFNSLAKTTSISEPFTGIECLDSQGVVHGIRQLRSQLYREYLLASNDILVVNNQLYQASILESLSGLEGALTKINIGERSDFIYFSSSVPHFLSAWQGEQLVVSLVQGYRDPAYHIYNSILVGMEPNTEGYVSESGVGLLNPENGSFSYIRKNMLIPSGVLAVGDNIWVADYADGTLRYLSVEGEVLKFYTGLQGPMGITQAPNGDLCIAEMLGGRISCYSLESLELE
jgi:hypothetical protein